ncbi:MAG: GNAT family N-acetyltransferase [Alphaproteobacteria bacterium]|nr:GNAT family N-acetyltransferase [Alphaproteobacteria bacterium]
MRLFETPLTRLSARDRNAWRALAQCQGKLISPYLMPEFAEMIDAERGDVRVVIAGEHGAPAGFFACHVGGDGVLRPAGAPLSDYQGFAGRAGLRVDVDALLDTLNARSLVYENWLGPAPGKVSARGGSAVIDMSGGAADWFAARRAQHRAHFRKMDQRWRKAEREFGPVRVVFGDPSGERFAALKAWKSAQYRASGLLDLFDVGWIDTVLTRIAARAFGPFRGVVASLYLGDELAAVEMGMAAVGVYHSWFPAYDPRFAAVSPGLLLLHGVLENAASLGVARIDLGRGEQAYKAYYTDYEIPLSTGRALRPGVAAAGAGLWAMAESMSAILPEPLASAPVRLRRRWSHTAAIEPDLTGRIRRMAGAFASAPRRLAAAG